MQDYDYSPQPKEIKPNPEQEKTQVLAPFDLSERI
jgi:hypothetical protein